LLCYTAGCGKLFVTDGIWKLRYPIFLYKVPVEIAGIKINLPDCCPHQPLHGKPFCQLHTDKLKSLGVPQDLLGFLKHFRDTDKNDQEALLGNSKST